MRSISFIVFMTLGALLPTAAAAPTCLDMTLCTGEATQACGDPAPYADGWDGFTGAWGTHAGVEYGVGGWDRCEPGDWAVGAFVNWDSFPLGRYETIQARFDHAPNAARECYLSGGAYGYRSQFVTFLCPQSMELVDTPNPGWGSVLS
jgi:hypothetical protein